VSQEFFFGVTSTKFMARIMGADEIIGNATEA
jgi:hypothetical protein